MKYGVYYVLSGCVLIALATYLLSRHYLLIAPGILMSWTGLSLLIVSVAYIFNRPRFFRKNHQGRIPYPIKLCLLPFFVGAHGYNLLLRKTDKQEVFQKIEDQLYLGRRITPLDLPMLEQQGINAVLDLTAEFDALQFSLEGETADYLNIPVLDKHIPSQEQANEAVNWVHKRIKVGKKVLIHCAIGRERSAIMLLAYLVARSENESLREILARVQNVRTTVDPTRAQLRWLEELVRDKRLQLVSSAWIIANPVAGGGKWGNFEQEVVERLSPYFDMQIVTTTKETGAGPLTKKALQESPDVVIACGGDGTLTEVASELINTQVRMGIIPLGTANALGQVLLGPQVITAPLSVSCDVIIGGRCSRIDTINCNGKVSLLMVGLGFEKDMIAFADREQKDASGVTAYMSGFVQAVSANESFSLKLCFDDEERELDVTSLVVANAAPGTSILAQGGQGPDVSDGYLDVTWLLPGEGSFSNAITMLDLCRGKASDNALIGYQRVKSLQVTTEQDMDYVIDGEVHSGTPLSIKVIPASLSVLVSE